MLLTKLKLAGTCLAIAALTTAGAGVLAQQGPTGGSGPPATVADRPETEARSAAKAIEKRTESIGEAKGKATQAVAKADTAKGVEIAQAALEAIQAFRARGERIDERQALEWSIRLLEAQRRANRPVASQVAALEDHVKRMKRALATVQSRLKAGDANLLDVLEAEFRYNEAVEWLKDATAKQPASEMITPGSPPGIGISPLPGAGAAKSVGGMVKTKAAMRPMGGPSTGMMAAMGGGGIPSHDTQEDQGRVEIGGFLNMIAKEDDSASTQSILKKLDAPVAMPFSQETPLEDILKYIKTATTGAKDPGMPIYVDPKGLEEANQTLTSKTSIDLEGVPLKTTLRLLLKQLGLAYCVKDGLLIISSVKGILQEVREYEGPMPGGFRCAPIELR